MEPRAKSKKRQARESLASTVTVSSLAVSPAGRARDGGVGAKLVTSGFARDDATRYAIAARNTANPPRRDSGAPERRWLITMDNHTARRALVKPVRAHIITHVA